MEQNELIKDQTKILYDWLRGNFDEDILKDQKYLKENSPKLSDSKSMTIIYFMQEFLRILPDTLEQCDRCKMMFDLDEQGIHVSEEDVEYDNNFNKKDIDKIYCEHCYDNINYYNTKRKLTKKENKGNCSITKYEFDQTLKEIAKKV